MATASEAACHLADTGKEFAATDNALLATDTKKKLDKKILKHSHDADAAMKAFEGMEGQTLELTPEKNKALLRKIDWHLMPVSVNSTQQVMPRR